jgi:hypothetical protein
LILSLEWPGYGDEQHGALFRSLIRDATDAETAKLFLPPTRRPWVAQIMGLHHKYGFERAFLQGQRALVGCNSKGTRGVHLNFLLEDWHHYEVCCFAGWSRKERYFLWVDGGEARRVSAEEIKQCLTQ